MWGEHEGMGWWMVLGTVWFVVFWAMVIWAFSRLFGREAPPRSESPIEIAKRRYASGEISREQFEQIRHDLMS